MGNLARPATKPPSRHTWILKGEFKRTLDKFLRDTHKVLKWPDIHGLFYEPEKGLFDMLTVNTDMNTIDLDAMIRVILEETVTTLVYEYARMADQVTSARASMIIEYIMGPELQTILEIKPVRLGRINTRVEFVANDPYSDPNESIDFFWNLNRFLIPLYYLEYNDDALRRDSDGWGRYLSTTCTLDKAIDVFKKNRNSKMETKGTLIWTVFSVIYAWLTPSAVRQRNLSDWEDGARQIKDRVFTVLDSDNAIHRQVARIVSNRLFDHDSIPRALTQTSAVQLDLGQRDPTSDSGPDLPADPYRPMPMPPRAKARGLTFGRLPEVPKLPSLNSTSGSAFSLADGSEPKSPEEEAPIPKSFLSPSPLPDSTRESALVRDSDAESDSSREETSIPEPFQYESPQNISIPRHDLPETIESQKRLKLNNGYKHTPKIKIVSAKSRESQHLQGSSPLITKASNDGYNRLNQLAALATEAILEKDKELKEKAEKEKAEMEKAEKEQASKAKRGETPRIWTEEECEICSYIIYAHQDTTQVPGGGYLCPSCVREDNLVFCAVCENVFTETPYTHLDQNEKPLCFKCWKEGPQDPGGKVMNDLSGDLLIPNILDLNLEAPYYLPQPTKSQSKGGHQDQMDRNNSEARVHKGKPHSTAQEKNSATMDRGDDDDDDDDNWDKSLILEPSRRINVSTDNMIASAIRRYNKFGA